MPPILPVVIINLVSAGNVVQEDHVRPDMSAVQIHAGMRMGVIPTPPPLLVRVLNPVMPRASAVLVCPRHQLVPSEVLARQALMAAVGHAPVTGTKPVSGGHVPVQRVLFGTAVQIRVIVRRRHQRVLLMVLVTLVLTAVAGGYVPVQGIKAVPAGHAPVLRMKIGMVMPVFVILQPQLVHLMVLAGLIIMVVMPAAVVLVVKLVVERRDCVPIVRQIQRVL